MIRIQKCKMLMLVTSVAIAVTGMIASNSFYVSGVSANEASSQESVQEAKRQFLEEGRRKSYTLYAGAIQHLRDVNVAAFKEQQASLTLAQTETERTGVGHGVTTVQGVIEKPEPTAEESIEDSVEDESVNVVVVEETAEELAEELADSTYTDEKGDTWELDADKALLTSVVVDSDYVSEPLSLSSANRDLLERLVEGEAGNEGFAGAAIVAQSLRDNMNDKGVYDTARIKSMLAYSGSTAKVPRDDVKKACSFIFDDGGMALQHRVLYFYAPRWTSGHWSSFHESQLFLIEWGGHRVFDRKE